MKLILISIVMMISLPSNLEASSFESLSCSSNGTQIFYVNGIYTLESSDDASVTTSTTASERINELLIRGNFKRKIDSKGTVFVDYIYNTSEGFILDAIQTVKQKIQEDDSIPTSLVIGEFFFKHFDFCSINPIVCAHAQLSLTLDMIKQEYTSRADIIKMGRLVKKSLIDLIMKVIIVSHSQGNLYANYLYEELKRIDVPTEKLNKFYANLQVGSAASSIKAENGRLYSAEQDEVIGRLRASFPNTLPWNYSYLEDRHEDQDWPRHGFQESYLSDVVKVTGPKKAKDSKESTAAEAFLDNLEKVAWMLANNDDECCEGEDGRFHINGTQIINGQEVKNVGGYVALTSKISKGVFIDEDSSVCGKVTINPEIGTKRFNIELEKTNILAFGPLKINGNVYFYENEIITNENVESRISNNHPEIPMIIQNSIVYGNPIIEGQVIIDAVFVFDNAKISGEVVEFNDLPYIPIVSATIHGDTTISGNYYIFRDIQDSNISGELKSTPSGHFNLLSLINNEKPLLDNVTIEGIGTIEGEVAPNTILRGRKIGTVAVTGISLDSTSKVAGRVEGGVMIHDHSDYSGTWITDQTVNESIVSWLEKATLNRDFTGPQSYRNSTLSPSTTVDGSIHAWNSKISGGTITGTLHIRNTEFNYPITTDGTVWLCNFDTTFGQDTFPHGTIHWNCPPALDDYSTITSMNDQRMESILNESLAIQETVRERRRSLRK